MNKLQEWEWRRRDMGLVPGYARKPSPRLGSPSLNGEQSSRSDNRPANKLEEWEQRRRDLGLVAGVPRRPSPPFASPEYDRAATDAKEGITDFDELVEVAEAVKAGDY